MSAHRKADRYKLLITNKKSQTRLCVKKLEKLSYLRFLSGSGTFNWCLRKM